MVNNTSSVCNIISIHSFILHKDYIIIRSLFSLLPPNFMKLILIQTVMGGLLKLSYAIFQYVVIQNLQLDRRQY